MYYNIDAKRKGADPREVSGIGGHHRKNRDARCGWEIGCEQARLSNHRLQAVGQVGILDGGGEGGAVVRL